MLRFSLNFLEINGQDKISCNINHLHKFVFPIEFNLLDDIGMIYTAYKYTISQPVFLSISMKLSYFKVLYISERVAIFDFNSKVIYLIEPKILSSF